MKLDAVFQEGRRDLPACVLIHGLGMDKTIWTAPGESKIVGRLFPLRALVRDTGELETLFHDLQKIGHAVAVWSQSRPVGPASVAVDELSSVVDMVSARGYGSVILIGHSRGGLIARKWLSEAGLKKDVHVKALITISSPHAGSTMAKWAAYLTPFASMIRPLLPETETLKLTSSIRRVLNFIESTAVRELLPESDFLGSLGGSVQGIGYMSAGGFNPTLVKIDGVLSIPGSLEKIFPGRLPEEMTTGKGDGLVSRRSARLAFADRHEDFDLNHAEMIVDKSARDAVVEYIKEAL